MNRLAEFPAILDSFFTGVANISSTPAGWEGGGWVGSHEVAGKGYVFTKTNQMASIGVIFTSTYHTKQLNPWPNSSASRACGELQPAVCLSRGYTAIWRWPVHSWTSDKPQKTSHSQKQPGQLSASIPGWIVKSTCTAIVWWLKSVFCYCVRGSRLFSDLVTHNVSDEFSFYNHFTDQWGITVGYCLNGINHSH